MSEKRADLARLKQQQEGLLSTIQSLTDAQQTSRRTTDEQQQHTALLDELRADLQPAVEHLTHQQATLHSSLNNLLGDSLLAAALTVYGGALEPEMQRELMSKCTAVVRDAHIAHSKAFSICSFMAAAGRTGALLPRGVQLDNSLESSLYLSSLARSYSTAFSLV